MQSDLYLEYTMKYMVMPLKIIGCFPDNVGAIKKLNRYLILIMLIYSIYVTLYTALSDWPDFPEMCLNASTFLAVVGANIKFANFWVKSKQFHYLRKTVITEFWSPKAPTSDTDCDVIRDYAKTSLKLSLFLTMLEIGTAVSTISKCFIRMFLINDVEAYNRRLLLYKNWVPFNIDIYADPLYQIIFTCQILGAIVLVSLIAAVDTSFILFVFNTCGQFKILNMKLRKFGDGPNQEQYLKDCIAQHQKLTDISDKLETYFNLIVFGNFVVILPYLCLSGFVLVNYTTTFYAMFENFTYVTCGLLQLFLYCYTAEQLTQAEIDIGDSAYASNWTSSPPKVRKLIILLILRAQKPIYLTGMKLFPVTIKTFETVSRSAMSYLTVLNSLNE